MPESATPSLFRARRQQRCWLMWLLPAFFVLFAAPSEHSATANDPPGATSARTPDLTEIERAFEQVVINVAPSVVGIRVQRRSFSAVVDGDDFDLHEQHVVVNGSGAIVSDRGLILTNEHVVQSAADIEVMFFDGQKTGAAVLAADPRSDLAILQVDRGDLPAVAFCDWDRVARGQWAIAIGNPFGLGRDGNLSVSIGIVSNLGRQLPGLGEVDDRFYSNMIQTTAAINPGNSGGPLFNVRGEMIGVVTAMHTRAPADEGVGFAIPLTPAKRGVVDSLCRGERVEYGYLGLTVRVPEREEQEEYEAIGHRGVIVSRVEPDGPAARADVRVGDLITRFDGEPMRGPAHMAEMVGHSQVGSNVAIELVRDQRVQTAWATVEVRDISRVSWMRGDAVLWRGMRLANLTDDARRLMRLDRAARGVVVIDVLSRSSASDAGIEIGDVIETVDGRLIHDTSDFLRQIRDAKGPISVSVRNHGNRVVRP